MRKAWDYVQDWDIELFGPEIQDQESILRWSRAFSIAGGLPFIWHELARPITDIIYSLLEAGPGDKILIIGEAIAPIGWDSDLRELVGDEGMVTAIEIIGEGREAIKQGKPGRNRRLGCWQWRYTDGIEDNAFDCVAVLQSAQHCDDWRETGQELLRVMSPGRRIVFAEAVYGGAEFLQRINADVHIRQWANKALETRMDIQAISQYSGEDLVGHFDGLVDDAHCLEWRGIEMFWGRKPRIGTVS